MLALGMLLALSGTLTSASTASDAAVADTDRATAPTTGRFVTTTTKGIVLVDEDGTSPHTVVETARRDRASLSQVHAATGIVLYSTGRQGGSRTTWHVASLYGVELGTFTVREGSTPVVGSGGYVAYWVQTDADGTSALMTRRVGEPHAEPELVRSLGSVSGARLAISPDNRWLAAATYQDNGAPGQLVLVATDGSSGETVPMPAGQTLAPSGPVFSPDSTRVAFETASAPGGAATLHTSAAVGDHTPSPVGPGPGVLFDWSPDGRTILGGTGPDLVSVDVATGQSRTFGLERRPATAPVFWSGLRAGAVPRDRVRPRLRIAPPDCGDRRPAACDRYRHTVAAWGVVGGPVADRGGSLLRYVDVAVFQRRGATWWALVGGTKHPTWRRFPTRNEARYAAKERTARLSDGRWRISIPGLTAGRLVVVAKAADGVGNTGKRVVAQSLG